MRQRTWLVVAIFTMVAGLLLATPARAATLDPAQIGAACAAGTIGTWHFVNNQTGGAHPGVLAASFADSGAITVNASRVNANKQHFYITGPAGPLLSAATDLPGKLVLKDHSCSPK